VSVNLKSVWRLKKGKIKSLIKMGQCPNPYGPLTLFDLLDFRVLSWPSNHVHDSSLHRPFVLASSKSNTIHESAIYYANWRYYGMSENRKPVGDPMIIKHIIAYIRDVAVRSRRGLF
jgi:hypothetical protein